MASTKALGTMVGMGLLLGGITPLPRAMAFNSYGHETITRKAIENGYATVTDSANKTTTIVDWCNQGLAEADYYPAADNPCAQIVIWSRKADMEEMRVLANNIFDYHFDDEWGAVHSQRACKISTNMLDDQRLNNAKLAIELAISARGANNVGLATWALGIGSHMIEDYFAHQNSSKANWAGQYCFGGKCASYQLTGDHYMCLPGSEAGNDRPNCLPQQGTPASSDLEKKALSMDGKTLLPVHGSSWVDDLWWDNKAPGVNGFSCTADAYDSSHWVSYESSGFGYSWRYEAAKKVVGKLLQAFLAKDVSIFVKALTRSPEDQTVKVFGADVSCVANAAATYNAKCP